MQVLTEQRHENAAHVRLEGSETPYDTLATDRPIPAQLSRYIAAMPEQFTL